MRRLLIVAAIILMFIILIVAAAAGLLGYQIATRAAPPTPTPVPPPIVSIEQIRQAAELATVKYTLSTDITATNVPDDVRQLLGVREEIVLIAYGQVAAGFDLSELGQQDLWTDGTRVQLHLPAPKILYTRLDTERTHVVYYKKSWLIEHDVNLQGQALQEAEYAIQQAALDGEVLERASEYGKLFFTNWFYSTGFTEVQVVVD
jgi:hypothetical protein